MGELPQAGFALADAVAFRRFMLDIYGYRCAITGRVHAEDEAEEGLDVFLLQPLAHGGALQPGNAVVVETAAARLLEGGLVQIGDDFLVYLPDPERSDLDADMAERLGRPLSLPESPSLWPDRAMLAYRRSLSRGQ